MPRTIKRGDRKPDLILEVALTEADLSTVVSWRLLIKTGPNTASYVPVVVVGADTSTAVLTHELTVNDTATTGTRKVEAEATWGDGTTTTFPTAGAEQYTVISDLG